MQVRALLTLSTLISGSGLWACSGTFEDGREPAAPRPQTQGSAGVTATNADEVRPPPPNDDTGGSEVGGSEAGGSEQNVEPPSGAGGSTDTLPPLPPVCDAPTKVLMASCGNGSCHSNENTVIGDFAADPERAYNFVDKLAVRDPDCGRIIDSRDYSRSFLLLKVRGDFEVPKCGERMPVGSFVITEAQIDCLASWLQQFQH